MTCLIISFCLLFFTGIETEEFSTSDTDSVEANFMVRNVSLFMETGLPAVTLDRVSFKPYNPYTGYRGVSPQIILDGIPVDADFFGEINPQFIPAALGNVETVESNSGFGLHNGQPYFPGVISIKNYEISEGVSFFGSWQVANEAGEPGPWVYDEERISPNVDRFGPGMDFGLNYRNGKSYVRTLYRYHKGVNSDLAIQERMRVITSVPDEGFYPQAITVNHTGLAEAGFKDQTMHVRVRGILGESDEFVYLPAFGREIPSDKSYLQGSIAADFNSSDREWEFRSLLQAGRKYLGYQKNRFDHSFDLTEKKLTAQLSIVNNFSSRSVEVGSRFRNKSYEAPGLDDEKNNYFELFTESNQELGENWLLIQRNNLTFSNRPVSVQTNAELWTHPASSWKTGLTAGYFEINPEFSRTLDQLVLRGYSLYDNLDMQFSLPERLSAESFFSIGSENQVKLSNNLNLYSNFLFISHRAFYIPFQEVNYNLSLHTSPGFYTLHENQTGSRAELTTGLSHKFSEAIQHNLHTVYNATISGGSVYRSYWDTVPDWQIIYTVDYQPFPDLELQASAWYRSSTHWAEFDAIDGEQFRSFHPHYPRTFGTFTSSTPSHLNINLKVAKWFWEQRVRAVLKMKNITNREFYSHPIGVREGFTFVLRAEFRF